MSPWLLAGSLADDDVALEVDPVRVGELEHGEEVGLGHAPDRVVRERRQDRRVGAAAVKNIEIVMHTLNGVYKMYTVFPKKDQSWPAKAKWP